MRHGLGYRKLNKTSEHRKALFKNMLNSLIKYEQIITTLPKAKELKPKIDKVITMGKDIKLSKKKYLFSKLQDQKSEGEMLRTPNFGRKSLNEIKEVLTGMSLYLGMEIPNWPPDNIAELSKKLEEAI